MNISVLQDLSNLTGASGNEDNIAAYLLGFYKKVNIDARRDVLGNIIASCKGAKEHSMRILIDAHMDEIGLMVTRIDEEGFVRFTNVGGIDNRILPAAEVIIHGKKDISGVIGTKPPHLQKSGESDEVQKIDDLFIDVGMACSQVENIVRVGDFITFSSRFCRLRNNMVSGKALDDRANLFLITLIMQELAKNSLIHDVYALHSVQEETGQAGAVAGAYAVSPDLAIVIDVTHAKTPDEMGQRTFIAGMGPTIMLGPNVNRKYTKKLIEIAEKNNIDFQIEVEPGDTGTNAWPIQMVRHGIPCVLLSVPLKYMHTTIESLSLSDIESARDIIVQFILSLTEREESIICC